MLKNIKNKIKSLCSNNTKEDELDVTLQDYLMEIHRFGKFKNLKKSDVKLKEFPPKSYLGKDDNFSLFKEMLSKKLLIKNSSYDEETI